MLLHRPGTVEWGRSRLPDVPERDDLGHMQPARHIPPVSDGLHELPEIGVRDDIPSVLLDPPRDLPPILQGSRLDPLLAELFVEGVLGPAECALLADRSKACDLVWIAHRQT